MCRLFGQISPDPASPRDFLVDSEFSLLRQSNFKADNLQEDGWGVAWYGNKNEAMVSKSSRPMFKEAERFKRLASGLESRVVLGHVRAASNPRGVPKKRLISIENSQPFTDGRWVFAHNGTLEIPDEAAESLGPLGKNIKGLNDSEVYFWLFVKFERQYKDAGKALRACVAEIWRVWESCKAGHPKKKGPYTSLNCLLSDGKSLHALNHFGGKGLAECGVCNPGQPWSVMSFTKRNGRLIVASENLDAGPWTRLIQPEILSAEIGAGRLSIRRRRFAAPASKATEPSPC